MIIDPNKPNESPVTDDALGQQMLDSADENTEVLADDIVGALIDSAGTSAYTAQILHVSRTEIETRESEALNYCLANALEWIKRARAVTIKMRKTPPSSIHIVKGL